MANPKSTEKISKRLQNKVRMQQFLGQDVTSSANFTVIDLTLVDAIIASNFVQYYGMLILSPDPLMILNKVQPMKSETNLYARYFSTNARELHSSSHLAVPKCTRSVYSITFGE